MKIWMRALVLFGLLSGSAVAEIAGEVVWARTAELSLPASGRVEKIAVLPGAAVEAGQVVLKLDARTVRATLADTRAAQHAAELRRAEAQREWDRAKELYDRTVLSERELQLAEIGFAAADAQYQAVRTAAVRAAVELEYTRLTAPFDAWVLAVYVAPGQAVVNQVQAVPLMRVAERGRLRLRTTLDAAQLATLTPDAMVAVQVGDRRFEARIVNLDREPLGAERPAHYAVEAEFAVPDDVSLRIGQTGALILP
jgi:multidrug efflux system membrane fusion protein